MGIKIYHARVGVHDFYNCPPSPSVVHNSFSFSFGLSVFCLSLIPSFCLFVCAISLGYPCLGPFSIFFSLRISFFIPSLYSFRFASCSLSLSSCLSICFPPYLSISLTFLSSSLSFPSLSHSLIPSRFLPPSFLPSFSLSPLFPPPSLLLPTLFLRRPQA